MDLTLIQIWHNATIATGCLADAIKAQKDNPADSVRKDLEEAANILERLYRDRTAGAGNRSPKPRSQ